MRTKVILGGVALLVTLTALQYASAATTYTWNAQSGTWSTTTNWLDSVPYVSGADNTADFSKVSLTADSTVALDTAIIAGNLIFGDAGTGGYAYTLNGNSAITLSGTTETNITANTNTTLSGGSTINLSAGTSVTNKATVAAGKILTVSDNFFTGSNSYLHKYGTGTMVLANTSDNVWFNVVAHEGTVEFASAGNTGCHAGGIAAIDANATVKFTAASNDGYQVWGDNSNGNYGSGLQPGGGVVNITGGTLDLYGHDQFLTGFTVSDAGGTLANSSTTTGATYTPYKTTLNGTLVVNTTSDITLSRGSTGDNSSGIDGVGGLTKNGDATLYLTSDNGYQGATTINAGTLQIGGGGSSGTLGTADVTNNGILRFDRSDNAYTVANAISGSGQLVKNGGGTITLTGTNGYAGNTTVNAGTLSVSDVSSTGNIGTGELFITGGTLAFTGTSSSTGRNVWVGSGTTDGVNVANGGTLEFTGIVRSNINANAYLNKYGTGTLTLSNTTDNSYLHVAAHEGTVLFNSASGQYVHAGSISAIDADATIQFTGSGDKQVWAGDIDGQQGGTIAITGGTLDLNGRSQVQTAFSVSSAGGTLANTNTAAASSYTPYSSTLDGTLTVHAVGDITLGVGTSGSASTGSGGITKTGSGKLTLSGENSYTGATAVNAGTLVVDGSITGTGGDVTVASGATLAGNGSIVRNLIIQSGGNITPGNSVGNLTVGGNVDFSGTYQWELGSLVDNASGTAGTNWDLVTMSLGTLSGSAPTISIAGIDPTDDSFWKSSHVWNIVTGIGASTLSTTGGDITGYDTQYGYFDTTGAVGPTGGIMQLTWTPVPEPSSIVLLAAGLIGLIAYAWRKRK